MLEPSISIALVTGGTRGIGKAITERLVARGSTVIVVARSKGALRELAEQPELERQDIIPLQADLADPAQIAALAAEAVRAVDHIDLLVHAAGAFSSGSWEESSDDLRGLFAVNSQGAAHLTALLIPVLRRSAGQVVFINSTQGLTASASVGAYAATKHALRAIADSLRHELNPYGVRILTIFPGATATAMQERIQVSQGRVWAPDNFMQPNDVADILVAAVTLPRTAEVTDITMRPLIKSDRYRG